MQFKNIIASVAALSVASVLASPIAAEKAVAAPAVKRDEFHYHYQSYEFEKHTAVYETSAQWAYESVTYQRTTVKEIDYVRVYQWVIQTHGEGCLDRYFGDQPPSAEGPFPFAVLFILGAVWQREELWTESQSACAQLAYYYTTKHGGSGQGSTDGGSGQGSTDGGSGQGSTEGESGEEGSTDGESGVTPGTFSAFNNGIFQNTGNIVNGDSNTGGIQGNDNKGNTVQSGNENQFVDNRGSFLSGLLSNGLLNRNCILSRC